MSYAFDARWPDGEPIRYSDRLRDPDGTHHGHAPPVRSELEAKLARIEACRERWAYTEARGYIEAALKGES